MAFAFGDIYFVKFDPSVGHEYKDDRPALVVQEEEISKISQLVTVIPLTSQLDYWKLPDIMIQKDQKNRLSYDSVLKVRHICTFDKSRFLFKIGSAGSPVIRQVRGYLRKHFGL